MILKPYFPVLAKNEAETTLKKKQQELLSEGKKQGGMHASEDHLKKAKILNREIDLNNSFRYNLHTIYWHSCHMTYQCKEFLYNFSFSNYF